MEKYRQFLQIIGEDLPTEIRDWLFSSQLTMSDCGFIAAFSYQNRRYFHIDDIINVLGYCNPNVDYGKQTVIYEEYYFLLEPEADFLENTYVFDIETSRVLSLRGQYPKTHIIQYPIHRCPEFDYNKAIICDGGGYVVYGYEK